MNSKRQNILNQQIKKQKMFHLLKLQKMMTINHLKLKNQTLTQIKKAEMMPKHHLKTKLVQKVLKIQRLLKQSLTNHTHKIEKVVQELVPSTKRQKEEVVVNSMLVQPTMN